MTDITYTPQFQPPVWQDNVDLMLAGGPKGFNIQFKSLRDELDALSRVVKQLSDTINIVSQTANAANTAAQAASTPANAANAANSTIQAIRWGVINSDGTKMSGSTNFTVTKAGTGFYNIIFDPAFTSIPAIQVTQIYWGTRSSAMTPTGTIKTVGGGDTRDNNVVSSTDMRQCTIKTGDSNGDANDRPFCFIAYGPPA